MAHVGVADQLRELWLAGIVDGQLLRRVGQRRHLRAAQAHPAHFAAVVSTLAPREPPPTAALCQADRAL